MLHRSMRCEEHRPVLLQCSRLSAKRFLTDPFWATGMSLKGSTGDGGPARSSPGCGEGRAVREGNRVHDVQTVASGSGSGRSGLYSICPIRVLSASACVRAAK